MLNDEGRERDANVARRGVGEGVQERGGDAPFQQILTLTLNLNPLPAFACEMSISNGATFRALES